MGISRYLGFFLDETRGYLNTLERGIQALEAGPADSGRMHEIYLSVSSIHGMALTMGFTRMQRLAEDMEGALLKAERTYAGDCGTESAFIGVPEGIGRIYRSDRKDVGRRDG